MQDYNNACACMHACILSKQGHLMLVMTRALLCLNPVNLVDVFESEAFVFMVFEL